jgi:hypothetical protein
MQSIVRGADWSAIIQIGTQPYEGGLAIASSAAGNPLNVRTTLPHQLVTNDKVQIYGHMPNVNANGNHTVVDAYNFTIPVTGLVAGFASGFVNKVVNGASSTVDCKMKVNAGGAEYTGTTLTFAWLDQSLLRCKVSLTDAQTPNLTGDNAVLYIKYTDSAGIDRIFTKEFKVTNG